MGDLERKWEDVIMLLADYGVPTDVITNELMPMLKDATVYTVRGILNEFFEYLEKREENK